MWTQCRCRSHLVQGHAGKTGPAGFLVVSAEGHFTRSASKLGDNPEQIGGERKQRNVPLRVHVGDQFLIVHDE
jgi:hypothetical protein